VRAAESVYLYVKSVKFILDVAIKEKVIFLFFKKFSALRRARRRRRFFLCLRAPVCDV
jgi:hypothetical protein